MPMRASDSRISVLRKAMIKMAKGSVQLPRKPVVMQVTSKKWHRAAERKS